MKNVFKTITPILLIVMSFAIGCTKTDGPSNDGSNSGILNGHEYVDLGLPSGTLWATCNMGSNSPKEIGNYFAWGETRSKTNYEWVSYQYCNGDLSRLTKYCNNVLYGDNGFVDGLTTLEQSDDAASSNWGDDWHVPSKAEWEELFDYCTTEWSTCNGVNGRLFTSSNGESIFLPASGYFRGDSIYGKDVCGYYWSKSLDMDNPSVAGDCYFDLVNVGINVFYRYYGLPIRPVYSNN